MVKTIITSIKTVKIVKTIRTSSKYLDMNYWYMIDRKLLCNLCQEDVKHATIPRSYTNEQDKLQCNDSDQSQIFNY